MKKITKVLGLLVVAAMLFVGCSPSTGNNNDNGGNNGNDSKDSVDDGVNDSSSKTVDFDTPLFDENSLTEDVDAIELSDGIWIYRRIDTDYYLNNKEKSQLEFSYKNGQIDNSKDGILNFYFSWSFTLPDDADEELKTKLKNLGFIIEGNNYSISKQYNKEELANLYNEAWSIMQENISDNEFIFDYHPVLRASSNYEQTLSDVKYDFWGHDSYKTNEDKTQYYWNPFDKEGFDTCFIAKK